MKKRIGKFRVLSAFLTVVMLLQPILPAIAAVSDAKNPERAVGPAEASSSSATLWQGVLRDVDGQLPQFQEYLRGRQQLYKEMRTCIDTWAKVLEAKGSQSQQPKLLAVAKEYGRRFAETLTKAEDFTTRFSMDLGRMHGNDDQFVLDSAEGSHRLALLYEAQERAGLLNSMDVMIGHLWDGFVASQILPLRPDQLEKDQLRQVLEAQAAVATKIQECRKSNEQWQTAWTQLERQENPEAQKINFPNEAKLLKAATKLADDAYADLRVKTDATTTAHVQMLERYRTVLLQKSEELQELTGQRDPQLLSESFLQLADTGKLEGEWRTLAQKQQEIVSELVKGLPTKAAAFDKAVSSAEALVAEMGKSAESLRGKSTGHDGMDQALQKVLADAGKDLQSASESLLKLDKARKKFTDALSAVGVFQGKTALLGDPRVAMYCDDLGQTYDLGEAVLLQISQHSGAIAHAAGVYRVSGAPIPSDSLTKVRGNFHTALESFSKVVAADHPILESHRQLGIQVLAKYNATISSASKQFKEVANSSGKSTYLPVLRQMSALFEKGADRINGLASPMLRAVTGPKATVGTPLLSWRGASTLGNAVTQLIKEGSYFERGAIDDAHALAKDGAGQSFSDSLRVVDLAMALHYPIRTLVAPDGMAFVVGNKGPGVVIRGIGNVEHFKLKNVTALLSPPDFTLGGCAIGFDFGGAFQNFRNDVGNAVHGAEQTVNNAAQGVEQFGAQVVNDTGSAITTLETDVAEVGGEFVKSHFEDDNGSFDLLKSAETVVTYVGYGIAIVATGGAATPLVAIAISADVGKSVVDVGKDNWGWNPQLCDDADFGLSLTEDVAGGLAGGVDLPSAISTAGDVINDVGQFGSDQDRNTNDRWIWQALQIAGGGLSVGGGLGSVNSDLEDFAKSSTAINMLQVVSDTASTWLSSWDEGQTIGTAIVQDMTPSQPSSTSGQSGGNTTGTSGGQSVPGTGTSLPSATPSSSSSGAFTSGGNADGGGAGQTESVEGGAGVR